MANLQLFSTFRGPQVPAADAINHAGGLAYQLDPKHALAQYALTGCLNGTFYADAHDQLTQVLALAAQVPSEFVAKLAIYARHEGYMKDMPALLCAILSSRDSKVFVWVAPEVLNTGKMIRTFVQIVRSGATGRKSLGTAPKRVLLNWLNRQDDDTLFRQSVGQSPSLADLIKMVHPNERKLGS